MLHDVNVCVVPVMLYVGSTCCHVSKVCHVHVHDHDVDCVRLCVYVTCCLVCLCVLPCFQGVCVMCIVCVCCCVC